MSDRPVLKDPEAIARLGRRVRLGIILLAALVGAFVWHLNMIHPRTNDAMVRANTIDIIIQHVSGRIVTLGVVDNQYVHKGDLLYAIDDRLYVAARDEAEAELHVAEFQIKGQMAGVAGAEAHIRETQNNLVSQKAEVVRMEAKAQYAQAYFHRIKPLEPEAFVTHNQINQAQADWKAADAAVSEARAKVRSTEEVLDIAIQSRNTAKANLAQTGNDYARVLAAEAKLREAELKVEYCKVLAPFDGYVTNLNTQVGQYVAAGQKLFALVDDTTWYVIANFKETYLRNIKPGQAVDVFLASYPGVHFRGEVQGTGWANYPDNVRVTDALPNVQRTLDWVMLAARFPVRITLRDRDPAYPFRMGMSAFTTVGIEPSN